MLKSFAFFSAIVIASGMALAAAHAQQTRAPTPEVPDFVKAFSGGWMTFDPSAAKSGHCSLQLTPAKSGNNYSASEESCAGELARVGAWGIVDQQLALLASDGTVLARLGGNQNRISGKLADGSEIILERSGVAREIHKQWASVNCLYYGYSTKCAGKTAEATPVARGADQTRKLSVLVNLNMRSEARPDAKVVSVIPAKSCVAVKQCTTASDGPWCEVSADGKSGWVAKRSVRLGKYPIVTYVNGCSQTK